MSGLQFTWLKKGPRSKEASPLLQVEDLSVCVGQCASVGIRVAVNTDDALASTRAGRQIQV